MWQHFPGQLGEAGFLPCFPVPTSTQEPHPLADRVQGCACYVPEDFEDCARERCMFFGLVGSPPKATPILKNGSSTQPKPETGGVFGILAPWESLAQILCY